MLVVNIDDALYTLNVNQSETKIKVINYKDSSVVKSLAKLILSTHEKETVIISNANIVDTQIFADKVYKEIDARLEGSGSTFKGDVIVMPRDIAYRYIYKKATKLFSDKQFKSEINKMFGKVYTKSTPILIEADSKGTVLHVYYGEQIQSTYHISVSKDMAGRQVKELLDGELEGIHPIVFLGNTLLQDAKFRKNIASEIAEGVPTFLGTDITKSTIKGKSTEILEGILYSLYTKKALTENLIAKSYGTPVVQEPEYTEDDVQDDIPTDDEIAWGHEVAEASEGEEDEYVPSDDFKFDENAEPETDGNDDPFFYKNAEEGNEPEDAEDEFNFDEEDTAEDVSDEPVEDNQSEDDEFHFDEETSEEEEILEDEEISEDEDDNEFHFDEEETTEEVDAVEEVEEVEDDNEFNFNEAEPADEEVEAEDDNEFNFDDEETSEEEVEDDNEFNFDEEETSEDAEVEDEEFNFDEDEETEVAEETSEEVSEDEEFNFDEDEETGEEDADVEDSVKMAEALLNDDSADTTADDENLFDMENSEADDEVIELQDVEHPNIEWDEPPMFGDDTEDAEESVTADNEESDVAEVEASDEDELSALARNTLKSEPAQKYTIGGIPLDENGIPMVEKAFEECGYDQDDEFESEEDEKEFFADSISWSTDSDKVEYHSDYDEDYDISDEDDVDSAEIAPQEQPDIFDDSQEVDLTSDSTIELAESYLSDEEEVAEDSEEDEDLEISAEYDIRNKILGIINGWSDEEDEELSTAEQIKAQRLLNNMTSSYDGVNQSDETEVAPVEENPVEEPEEEVDENSEEYEGFEKEYEVEDEEESDEEAGKDSWEFGEESNDFETEEPEVTEESSADDEFSFNSESVEPEEQPEEEIWDFGEEPDEFSITVEGEDSNNSDDSGDFSFDEPEGQEEEPEDNIPDFSAEESTVTIEEDTENSFSNNFFDTGARAHVDFSFDDEDEQENNFAEVEQEDSEQEQEEPEQEQEEPVASFFNVDEESEEDSEEPEEDEESEEDFEEDSEESEEDFEEEDEEPEEDSEEDEEDEEDENGFSLTDSDVNAYAIKAKKKTPPGGETQALKKLNKQEAKKAKTAAAINKFNNNGEYNVGDSELKQTPFSFFRKKGVVALEVVAALVIATTATVGVDRLTTAKTAAQISGIEAENKSITSQIEEAQVEHDKVNAAISELSEINTDSSKYLGSASAMYRDARKTVASFHDGATNIELDLKGDQPTVSVVYTFATPQDFDLEVLKQAAMTMASNSLYTYSFVEGVDLNAVEQPAPEETEEGAEPVALAEVTPAEIQNLKFIWTINN